MVVSAPWPFSQADWDARKAAEREAGGSTSARLRQALQDLAASQADLTRVEAMRDEYRRQADLARDELANAARSSWIVARDGGRDCLFCWREIRRGEAYELVPGEGPDALRHIHCPDDPANRG